METTVPRRGNARFLTKKRQFPSSGTSVSFSGNCIWIRLYVVFDLRVIDVVWGLVDPRLAAEQNKK